ncbi:hypothetical protein AYI68_g4945 [Smittium mucronatum]|uniref:Uncharacterized protein n=1 Tax=Smittium mucronatum TaxID=133383 RepID=A0A1R0GVM6_9FUNG|nr:hypothetical protein AYI68_g4945 [Smittium mucronatum]
MYSATIRDIWARIAACNRGYGIMSGPYSWRKSGSNSSSVRLDPDTSTSTRSIRDSTVNKSGTLSNTTNHIMFRRFLATASAL